MKVVVRSAAARMYLAIDCLLDSIQVYGSELDADRYYSKQISQIGAPIVYTLDPATLRHLQKLYFIAIS